jgi:aryl-alcohol dehydrogenase-like predicted oxidoreductase
MARHWDMAVMPWGLLESGILTGKFLSKTTSPTRINPDKLELNEKTQAVVKEVQKVAAEIGRSMSQVAINWVRQQQNKSQMIPIIGARNATQLKDNLGVLEWRLDDDQLKCLDEVSKIDMGFPHGFLEENEYIFGSTYNKIDRHRRG